MNIVFIGMPGCGKSRLARMIANKLGRPFVDVDEFIFQETGKDSAEHLAQLGDDKFLDFESEISQRINMENGVIATTGSNPLRQEGIDHLRKNAITVWLDVPIEIIEARVGKRKDGDSRIVGAQTMTFPEILSWRLTAYQNNHDIHFQLGKECPKQIIARRILNLLQQHGIR